MEIVCSSTPIVPISASINDLQYDQRSSSMVNTVIVQEGKELEFSLSKIDQFMIGQGFNSERMSANFDKTLSNDYSQSPPIAASQTNSTDMTLGKKVISFIYDFHQFALV